MTTAPSIEERLRHARGLSALLTKLASDAAQAPDDAPPKAFWHGLADVAEALENDVAAVQKALDMHATERPAPAVFVER